MDEIELNENKTNLNKTLKESDKFDTATFDKTLTLIEKTLKNLGDNVELKEEMPISKQSQEENINKNQEHIIDNTHLKMDQLHNFSNETNIKNKTYFGFYTYLALSIGVIFAIYEILNVSKNLIILKYPVTEPYIEYFYEVIEILAYLVMNTITFLRNLF